MYNRIKRKKEKDTMRKYNRRLYRINIFFVFVFRNQAKCFYTRLHVQCKFQCTVLISKFTRFCRYSTLLFSRKKELNCVTLSALLCLHSLKKETLQKKREERGFSEHSVLVKFAVSCSFQKGSSMNDCILLCFVFYFTSLFVCTF